MDLYIKAKSNEKENYAIIKRLMELGWDGMSWTQTILWKGGMKVHIQAKAPVELSPKDLKEALDSRKIAVPLPANPADFKFQQYNRLNVVVNDLADAQSLTAGNDQFKSFDILSATPGSAQVFAYLCKTADIDIIHIDFTHRTSFPLQKKIIDAAVQRGIYFELQYSPVLSHSTRPDVFANTPNVIKFLRGRNIITSSGSDSSSTLRAPMDATNIAVLLGLNPQQARESIFQNVNSIIRHGEARKHRYLPVRVMSMSTFEEKCRLLATGMKQTNNDNPNPENNKKKRKRGDKADKKKRGKKARKRKGEEGEDEESEDYNEEDTGASLNIEGDDNATQEESEDFLKF